MSKHLDNVQLRVTPTLLTEDTLGNDGVVYPAGYLHWRLEWLDVYGAVQHTEEIVLPPDATYVSQVRCDTPAGLARAFVRMTDVAGNACVALDWHVVEEGEHVQELCLYSPHVEVIGGELNTDPTRRGPHLLSSVRLSGMVLGGTFWLSADGNRHYLIRAEPGNLNKLSVDAAIAVK